MDHQPRLERLLIGLRGLGVLRGWPLGDEAEADAQLTDIADMLKHREESPMSDTFPLEEFDHATGYAYWAETYDDGGNTLLDVESHAMRELLTELDPGETVDVACGTGRITDMLCSLGYRVTGVDPSVPMLAKARSRGLPAVFVEGSFDAIPLPDASVDLATCGLALTHATDLHVPVLEIARVVRPGGHVVLSDVHPFAVETGFQAVFRRSDGSRAVTVNHLHQVSDYVRAFTAAGLVIEGCEEPLVDEGFKTGLRSDDVRAAADVGLTGMPLLLLWRLRRS
jgi:SAM-dependent methyltransferase